MRATTNVQGAGRDMPRRSADCTRSTAASFEQGLTARVGHVGSDCPMKISAKAEYACLAVLALARQGPESSPVHIHEISEAYGIPERYLVQILLQLKGAGLVASTRGAAGGYHLGRDPQNIPLADIIAVVDRSESPA